MMGISLYYSLNKSVMIFLSALCDVLVGAEKE